MQRNSLILFNILTTYGRMGITAVLSIISSRWLLSALGVTDFGLYSLIAGITVFFTFLNGSLSTSLTRYLAYSAGKRDHHELADWFSIGFWLHLGIALFLLFISIPCGIFLIKKILNIPVNKMNDCYQMFALVLIMMFANIVITPFSGLLIAKQKIFLFNLVGLINSILLIGLSFFLLNYNGNRLLAYAYTFTSIHIIMIFSYYLFCHLLFPYCRVRIFQKSDLAKMKDLFSFAGWTMFGIVGNMGREQTSTFLLNVYFGAKLNAAWGIATQLTGQVSNFSTAIQQALTPDITSSAGAGEYKRMKNLSLKTSKITALLSLILTVPLLSDTSGWLHLWLKQVPDYAVPFSVGALLTFILERLSSGHTLALNANGKIAWYQVSVGIIQMMTFPITWIVLHYGCSPLWVIGISLFISGAAVTARVFWGWFYVHISFKKWITTVLFPCLIVGMSAWLISYAFHLFLLPKLWHFLGLLCVGGGSVVLLSFLFGIEADEKEFLKHRSMECLGKFLAMISKST